MTELVVWMDLPVVDIVQWGSDASDKSRKTFWRLCQVLGGHDYWCRTLLSGKQYCMNQVMQRWIERVRSSQGKILFTTYRRGWWFYCFLDVTTCWLLTLWSGKRYVSFIRGTHRFKRFSYIYGSNPSFAKTVTCKSVTISIHYRNVVGKLENMIW